MIGYKQNKASLSYSYSLGKIKIHIIAMIWQTLQGKEHFELVEVVSNSCDKIIDLTCLGFLLKQPIQNLEGLFLKIHFSHIQTWYPFILEHTLNT